MLTAAVLAAVIVGAVAGMTVVHRRQWHQRLLRQIRALPEHHGERSLR